MALLIGVDPEWQQRQNERLGNALQMIAEMKQRKEAREEAEIQKYISYISEYPELADTVGQDMIRKHGRKRPELVSLVSTIQNENRLRRESETQLNRYSQAYAKEIGDRKRFYDFTESMPDELPMPLGLTGQVVPVPNSAKMAARSQQATMAAPEWSAFSKLSDEEKHAVLVAMHRNGIKPPEPPKTIGPEDLSQAQRGLLAMGLDITSPEFQTVARAEGGLIEEPAAVAKRKEDVKVEETKNEREAREQKEREDRAAAEWNRRHNISTSTQYGLIAAREKAKPESAKKTPEEKEADKDLNKSINFHLNPRLPNSSEYKSAAEIGEEPENTLTAYAASEIRKLAKLAVQKEGLDPDAAAVSLLERYDELIAQKKDAATALNILKQEASSPPPK